MAYVPDRGHIIWLTFDPQAGREQAGRRPAIVLTPASYTRKTGLLLVCPVTNQAKGYPFEVPIPAGLPVTGVALADHIKSADWHARNGAFICQAPQEVLTDVAAKLATILPSATGSQA